AGDLRPRRLPPLVAAVLRVLDGLQIARLNHAQHLATAVERRAEHCDGGDTLAVRPAVFRMRSVPLPRHETAHAVRDHDEGAHAAEVRVLADASVQLVSAPANVTPPVVAARGDALGRNSERGRARLDL